ncbi:MAG: DUF6106 family protein [Defluviitaleaceae bacterium]|nr:DUF6106 family protein [Defluviitaleaceae bacterium]
MGDVFKEQIVKRKATVKDAAIRVCLIVIVILIFFISSMILQSLSIIITAAALFGAIFIMSYLNVEYEYVFTNGELDIDTIYNKSRRKRLLTAKVNDFEIMAHIDDKNHAAAFGTVQETRDYSSGVPGPDTYMCLLSYKGKKTKLIIEPNEKMLKAIAGSINRRKLFLRPGVVLVS